MSKNFQSLDPFPILQTYKSWRRMPVCLRCSLNRSQPNELIKTKAQIGYKLDIKCSLTFEVAYGPFISKVHTHRAFIGNFWQPTSCFLSMHMWLQCVLRWYWFHFHILPSIDLSLTPTYLRTSIHRKGKPILDPTPMPDYYAHMTYKRLFKT